MMKTKEEILEKFCEGLTTFIHLSDKNNIIDGDANAVLLAMDEYAEQEAIGFGIWISSIDCGYHPSVTDNWFHLDEIKDITTKELYSLYLKSKTK